MMKKRLVVLAVFLVLGTMVVLVSPGDGAGPGQAVSADTSRVHHTHPEEGGDMGRRKTATSGAAAVADYSRRPPGFTALKTVTKFRANRAERAPFALVDLDGNVTDKAISHFGIDEKELPLVKDAARELRDTMKKLIAANVIRVPSSDGDPSVRSYKLASFSYDSEGAFAAFLDNLTAVVGAERAWDMAKTMETGGVAAAYGQLEMNFEIRDRVSSDPQRVMKKIAYHLVNPSTGKEVSSGLSPDSSMNRLYFGALDDF